MVRWIDSEQLGLGRPACGCDGGRTLRDAQVAEDGAHDPGTGEEGEDAHLAMAGGTAQRVDLVDASKQLRPATTRATAFGRVMARGVGCGGVQCGLGAGVGCVRGVPPVAGRLSSPPGVWSEDAVIAMPVDARRWNQTREAIEELEGADPDRGTPVLRGPGQLIDQACVGRAQRHP